MDEAIRGGDRNAVDDDEAEAQARRRARAADRACFAHPILVAQLATQIHTSMQRSPFTIMNLPNAVMEARKIVDLSFSQASDDELGRMILSQLSGNLSGEQANALSGALQAFEPLMTDGQAASMEELLAALNSGAQSQLKASQAAAQVTQDWVDAIESVPTDD